MAMAEQLQPLSEGEQLKAENDFLKMKLALEKGAQFGSFGERPISPQLENEFLKNILEYEKQAENIRTITVFEKIGRPSRFKPVADLKDSEMDRKWEELSIYLFERGINLDACSPNVGSRELYRFAIEELFPYEMEEVNIPGMMHCFIYDEFHPDPLYESERVVTGDLFPRIFNSGPADKQFNCFPKKDIFLNNKIYASREDLFRTINHFKSFFAKIELQQTWIDGSAMLNKEKVKVTGRYKASAVAFGDPKKIMLEGNFSIETAPHEYGFWDIERMQIGEISF
jgi:hypothetical protein